MTVSRLVEAMKLAGCTSEQIGIAVVAYSGGGRSSAAERQARYRARKAENVTRDVTRDVTVTVTRDVTTVTPEAEKSEPRARVLYCEDINIYTPSKPTVSRPPKSLQPENRPAKKSRARDQIAETAQPSQADVNFAVSHGLVGQPLSENWARFVDHHRAKGNTMADWAAAWRTWVRNSGRFSNGPPGARAAPAPRKSFLDIAAEMSRESHERPDHYAGPTIDAEAEPDAASGGSGAVSHGFGAGARGPELFDPWPTRADRRAAPVLDEAREADRLFANSRWR